MASATQLCKRDRAILGAILEPEAGIGNGNAVVEPCAQDESYYDPQTTISTEQQEKDILLLLNEESPPRSQVERALSELDSMLRQYPMHVAGYNNRAQARRLLYPDFQTLASNPEQVHAIFEDLAQAISLKSSQGDRQSVSPKTANILSSAHTHRGYLLYMASQQTENLRKRMFSSQADLEGLDGEVVLELASRDFALGGKYGNKAAKQLALHTNPYTKLCGNIVKEAIHKELEMSSRGSVVV